MAYCTNWRAPFFFDWPRLANGSTYCPREGLCSIFMLNGSDNTQFVPTSYIDHKHAENQRLFLIINGPFFDDILHYICLCHLPLADIPTGPISNHLS